MVETARLQLAYTTIRAPMDGRTGNLLVQGGNVVKSNEDNPLVVIAQIRPIYVSFAVPEQHLAAIEAVPGGGHAEGRGRCSTAAGTRVVGAVTFMNNTVDATTGTIQLKATFPNADNALWPGQFVDVALTLTTRAGGGGAVPGRPGRPAGTLRVRGEARSHRGVAPGEGRAAPAPGRS